MNKKKHTDLLQDRAEQVIDRWYERIDSSFTHPQQALLENMVLQALVATQAEAFSEGWNARGQAALAQVNALKQTLAISRDRAEADGRTGVASYRQSDIETCDRVMEVIQSISAKESK